MGAMPPTAAITFSTRTSRAPVARSTITARPMTMAQPPAKPWTNRAAIMTAIVGASAHTTDASAITTTAAISGPPAAALVRHRSADQLPERHADEEGRQGELHLGGGRGQVGGDLRERRHVHVGGQRRDRGQEHHGRDQGRGEPGPVPVAFWRRVRAVVAEVFTVRAVAQVR